MRESRSPRVRTVTGALLGTALGDALGLPYEGLSAKHVARRTEGLEDRGLVGARLFVSDDTEQTALTLEALVLGRGDVAKTLAIFRRLLGSWFLRLPFGIGLSTLRACLRILFRRTHTGIASAGNGAAMRAGIVGVFSPDDDTLRRSLTEALARTTHTDPRAIEGALYTAELAAHTAVHRFADRRQAVLASLSVVRHPELRGALEAVLRAPSASDTSGLAPNTGYVVHTLALCTWAFLWHGETPLAAILAVIRAGGDTDTAGAIVGGWLGAWHGPDSIPPSLLRRIDDGPFGPTHLTALAESVASEVLPRWSPFRAMLRNLSLLVVVVGHGFARLLRGELF